MSTTVPASSSTAPTDAATQLPAAGTWVIEPTHSAVEAVVRHLMVSKVRGRFTSFEGTVTVGDSAAESTIEVTIDPATIDTNEAQRDAHLKSADFLDVERYPTITFRSSGATHVEGDRWSIPGELTIRGTTRPITLEATYLGLVQDPWGNTRAVLSATAELDREAFGMTWNQGLETGGVLVSKKVTVELDVQLVRQQG